LNKGVEIDDSGSKLEEAVEDDSNDGISDDDNGEELTAEQLKLLEEEATQDMKEEEKLAGATQGDDDASWLFVSARVSGDSIGTARGRRKAARSQSSVMGCSATLVSGIFLGLETTPFFTSPPCHETAPFLHPHRVLPDTAPLPTSPSRLDPPNSNPLPC
jgi:hypothetical protein